MKRFFAGPRSLCQASLWITLAVLGPSASALAQSQEAVESKARLTGNIQTTDYLVPHISTVPATVGKRVSLFVREKVQTRKIGKAPVVLMIAGTTVSALPAFDVPFENYSWMEYLANAGFDAFTLDLTGYGLSPRPMMENACNAAAADQQTLLVPKTLAQPCPPAYPFRLTTSQSDWDEIDAVVDYLRQRRGVDKVHLIGWSLGGPRAGGYAARHPEKVDKLFIYAPLYDRLEPSGPPAVLPEAGVPIAIRTISAFYTTMNSTVKCANQFNPGIRDVIRTTMLTFDPLGSTWGSEELWRSPAQNTRWGWNPPSVRQVKAPTLVISGDLDATAPQVQATNLFADLVSVPQKVFVHVACTGHTTVWENQHMVLLDASVEWLKQGTYRGNFNGSFAVDAAGQVRQEQ
ncbi:MAG: alpha/beta fold hydrolase [Acidobacteria bacterium]|nr:alpha/beta fold hydrolase [Acidobacteriota bacterium]